MLLSFWVMLCHIPCLVTQLSHPCACLALVMELWVHHNVRNLGVSAGQFRGYLNGSLPESLSKFLLDSVTPLTCAVGATRVRVRECVYVHH